MEGRLQVLIYGMSGKGGYPLWLLGPVGVRGGLCAGSNTLGGQE